MEGTGGCLTREDQCQHPYLQIGHTTATILHSNLRDSPPETLPLPPSHPPTRIQKPSNRKCASTVPTSKRAQARNKSPRCAHWDWKSAGILEPMSPASPRRHQLCPSKVTQQLCLRPLPPNPMTRTAQPKTSIHQSPISQRIYRRSHRRKFTANLEDAAACTPTCRR